MHRRNLLTVIVTSVVLSGCSSDSDTSETTGTNTPVGGDVVTSTIIDGTWISDCRNGDDVSSLHEFVALNGNVQDNFTFFNDPNCTVTESALSEMATYTVGDSVTVSGSVEGITSANKIDYIGGSSTAFDIVGISSNGNTLYFGDFLTGNGDTDATRSTQLDLSEKYTRTDATGTSTSGGGGVIDTAVSAKYEGIYLEGCTAEDEDDTETEYEITSTTIVGTTSTIRVSSYTDGDCFTPAENAEIVFVESLVYPGGTVQTNSGVADFVDITRESITINGQPLSAGQLQEATAGGEFNTEYDIFLLVDNALFRGENTEILDGASAVNRPTNLEAESVNRL